MSQLNFKIVRGYLIKVLGSSRLMVLKKNFHFLFNFHKLGIIKFKVTSFILDANKTSNYYATLARKRSLKNFHWTEAAGKSHEVFDKQSSRAQVKSLYLVIL